MLTFPAKAPDAGTATGFEHGNYNDCAAHPYWLFVSNRKQRVVRYGLYEAIAKCIRRDPETPNEIPRADSLDDIGVSSPRVYEGPAQGLEELTVL
jgi:hypothetical protein